jgi:hypothetical protein
MQVRKATGAPSFLLRRACALRYAPRFVLPRRWRKSVIKALAYACTAAVMLVVPLTAAPPLNATLTLRAYNTYGVPVSELRTAARTVQAMLSRIAIPTVWRNCRIVGRRSDAEADPCTDPVGVNELIIRVVGGAKTDGEAGAALGYSSIDGRRRIGTLATIFADRVSAVANSLYVDRGTLFGRAVAHEVGHLLLGESDHPSWGLMRGYWSGHTLIGNKAEDWIFSAEQGEQMRLALAGRLLAAAPRIVHAEAERENRPRQGAGSSQ